MVEVKRVKAPRLLKLTNSKESTEYRLEQTYQVDNIEVMVHHNCFAFNNGSVAFNDFDRNSFEPLNEKTENELIAHFGKGKAFEVMELISMDVDDTFKDIKC